MNISIQSSEYHRYFWNVMKGLDFKEDSLLEGRCINIGSFKLPASSNAKYETAISKESLFRKIGTVFNLHQSDFLITARDCNDVAEFVPANGVIPIYEGLEDFTKYKIDTWKLASITKLDEDFVHDDNFAIEDYLVKKFSKAFGRGETKAFINGTGVEMPTGILNATGGAKVGATSSTLTYDDVIKLYFSLKAEYREKAVWLMNDITAMALRTLKDSSGNYLWRNNDDSIFGKKVIISEFMPDAATGTKPIAFGDFSYYWVVSRRPVSIRSLKEKFAYHDQIGYLGYEFLDGKLIRPEAVKVLSVEGGEAHDTGGESKNN